MGNMVPVITRRDEPSARVADTNPARADWITAHARASGLSIAEVARLWLRFQQLGCSAGGFLSDQQIRARNNPVGEDAFLRNIMTKIKDKSGPDGVVTFISYINTMYWLEVATTEQKIRACFYLLNNGKPLTEPLVRQVLSKVFDNETVQELDRKTKALFEIAGSPATADEGMEIREEAFVSFCRQAIPPPVLESILDFQVVPRKVTEEAKLLIERDKAVKGKNRGEVMGTPAAGSEKRPSPAPRNMHIESSYQIPTSGQLDLVAGHIYRRDFRMVGNKLGFFESDMNHMENMYPGDKRQQVAFLLHEWRKREGARAYTILLQRALQEANMSDVASMLQPNATGKR